MTTHTVTPAARPAAQSTVKPQRIKHQRGMERSTLLTILLWLCAGYFVLPLFWLVVASTKDNSDLFSTFGLWFGNRFALWDNLVSVFTVRDGLFLQWVLNTVLYAGVSAVGASVLATAAGYAFAKYKFPGDKLLFSINLGAIMIPADAISDSLIEAARVDGAGEFRIFWQVGFRLLGPGVVTVFLFALVATWNNYFLPLIMLNSSSLYPLTVGLAQQQAASAAGGGAQALFSTVITGSLVSIIPLIIAFLVLQRYWQAGLTAGGVKE
jgi:multiple sugar transport system permease protein